MCLIRWAAVVWARGECWDKRFAEASPVPGCGDESRPELADLSRAGLVLVPGYAITRNVMEGKPNKVVATREKQEFCAQGITNPYKR
jgi:hypothetical protein